jgi:hypothetical protein
LAHGTGKTGTAFVIAIPSLAAFNIFANITGTPYICIPVLRAMEKVEPVVMISELGPANNIGLAKIFAGIEVILSSDMHEETRAPVVTGNGTILIEEGQDDTMLSELRLKVINRRVVQWKWTAHNIDSDFELDLRIAKKISTVRLPFVSGAEFTPQVNPLNGTEVVTRYLASLPGMTADPCLNRIRLLQP